MVIKRYISADEVNALFHQPVKRRPLLSWQLISAALLIVIGVFTAMNAPALDQQLRYWWATDIQASKENRPEPGTGNLGIVDTPTEQSGQNPEQSTNPLNSSQTGGQAAIQPASNRPTVQVVAQSAQPQLADNTIYIRKIGVKAPIIWDVSGGSDLNSDLLKALQNGVVRYPRTALPNQVGNLFLTGHSSNYWWEKGNYKTVFALLNRLVVGDLIHIKYQGQLYTYRVNGQKVVKPTETSVLNPTATPTLSLMTCTPTGTTLLRRIVTADLIEPKEGLATQQTKPTDFSALGSVR